MKHEQISKLLKVAIIATSIILLFEGIFSIPGVNEWFSNLITLAGNWSYLVIWVIMFLQVTVLNIPAYVILSASVSIGINTLSVPYILVVLSAYMCGAVLAYWLGRKFGVKAVKWCAGSEEDFEKWSNTINNKGKLIYLATVLFPMFPDDLLCIVAGSIKMNFAFYVLANAIGRAIGLIAMLLTLQFLGSIGGGFPYMLIIWGVALITEIIFLLIYSKRGKNGDKRL